MTKKKKQEQDIEKELPPVKDEDVTEETEIGKVTFSFTMTRDEAEAVIYKPKSVVARKLRRYMYAILKSASQKFVDSKKDEIVKECKLNIDESL